MNTDGPTVPGARSHRDRPMPEASLASDAEVQAALADADVSAIPSLDDGASVIPVPVPMVQTDTADAQFPVATALGSDAAKPDSGPAEAAGEPPPPAGWAARLYALADRALDTVNRPFRWMPDIVRQATGISGLCMLGMAIIALTVLPLFRPLSATGATFQRAAPTVHRNQQPASAIPSAAPIPATQPG